MGTLLHAGYEGQTVGVTPTVANSTTFGDAACLTPVLGAGTTMTYDNTHPAHGTMGIKLGTASAVSDYLPYAFNTVNATGNLEFYFYYTAAPTVAELPIGYMLTTTSVTIFDIVINTSGTLRLRDASGSSPVGATALGPGLTANTLYRFALQTVVGASSTTGQVSFAYYLGDSLTPVATFSSTAVNTGTTSAGRVALGRIGAGTAAAISLYYDDPQWQEGMTAGAFIGPYSTAVSQSVGIAGSGSVGFQEIDVATGLGIAGSGAVSVASAQSMVQSVGVAGSGSVSVVSTEAQSQSAGIAGSGSLTVQDTQSFVSNVGISGSGSVSVVSAQKFVQSSSITGSGSLSVTSAEAQSQAVGISGSGSLSVATGGGVTQSVGVTGSGSLSVSSKETQSSSVGIAGSGSLSVGNRSGVTISVGIAGSGSVAVAKAQGFPASVGLVGSGFVAITSSVTSGIAAGIVGSGSVDIQIASKVIASVGIVGSGSVTVTASNPLAKLLGSATMLFGVNSIGLTISHNTAMIVASRNSAKYSIG